MNCQVWTLTMQLVSLMSCHGVKVQPTPHPYISLLLLKRGDVRGPFTFCSMNILIFLTCYIHQHMSKELSLVRAWMRIQELSFLLLHWYKPCHIYVGLGLHTLPNFYVIILLKDKRKHTIWLQHAYLHLCLSYIRLLYLSGSSHIKDMYT